MGLPDVASWRVDDQSACAINIAGVELPDSGAQLTLWVSWYKRRGRTDAMWLLNEKGEPTRPTEADCIAICYHHGTLPEGAHEDRLDFEL